MQQQKSGFSVLFLVFLIVTRQVGWQGYGQVNSTVVSTVMGFIDSNIRTYTGTSDYDTFNTALSDRLNSLWDPAWNVFTIKTTSAFDTVLYGYAFRDQWMWYNDYRVDGVVLAFVVWKDYNCQGWKTVGKNGRTTGLLPGNPPNPFDNIIMEDSTNLWSAAKSISDRLDVGGKFSVIVSQDMNSVFYGRICVVDFNHYYFKVDKSGIAPFGTAMGQYWGNALFFQTR